MGIISLGIGSPASIKFFILVGLDTGVAPDPSVDLGSNWKYQYIYRWC